MLMGSGLHTSEGKGMRTVGDIMCHMFSSIYSTGGSMHRGESIYAKFLHCWGMWWILSSYFIHFSSIVFFYMLLLKKNHWHTSICSHLPGKPVNQWKYFWLSDQMSDKNVLFSKVSRSSDRFNVMQDFYNNFSGKL